VRKNNLIEFEDQNLGPDKHRFFGGVATPDGGSLIRFEGEPPTTIGVAAFHNTHPDLVIYYNPAALNADAFRDLFDAGKPMTENVFWSDPAISVDGRAANPAARLREITD